MNIMIDDKKIEEAAINKCGFISSEFYSGAKWAINEFLKDLWHPADEEPKDNATYLAQIGNGAFDTFADSKNWETFSKGINISRWLYVEKLLPKEGGNHD